MFCFYALFPSYYNEMFNLGKKKGKEEDCRRLVDFLNTILPGVIKFKSKFSTEKIEFLDLEISIEEGKLETNLYIKPSNFQLYLDYFSNHLEQCKVGPRLRIIVLKEIRCGLSF